MTSNTIKNGDPLSESDHMSGKLVGAFVGGLGAAIAANLMSDVVPALGNNLPFYGVIAIGGLVGYTMFGDLFAFTGKLLTI